MRAFAALWVVLHHLRVGLVRSFPEQDALHGFLEAGYLGVDLFAILSGFVISLNYAERLQHSSAGEKARYLWLRVARVYPLHLFTLLLLLLAVMGIDGFASGPEADRYRAGDFWQSLLLVHGWGFAERLSWNGPSWTVSSEWFCYLAFPLLVPLVPRIRTGAVAVLAAAAVLAATLQLLGVVGYPRLEATVDWGLLRIGGEFTAGCLLWRAYALRWGAGLPWSWIGSLAMAAAVGLASAGQRAGVVACFAVVVYALAHPGGPLVRLFGSRLLVFWGEASYSIYMVHWVLIKILRHALPESLLRGGWGLPRGSAAAITLAIILASAACTWWLVERPSRRWLRGWIGAR